MNRRVSAPAGFDWRLPYGCAVVGQEVFAVAVWTVEPRDLSRQAGWACRCGCQGGGYPSIPAAKLAAAGHMLSHFAEEAQP